MSGADRYPAALWHAGRFLFEPTANELDVSDPDSILASAGAEIETEVAAMLRGGTGKAVTALCWGAVAVRQFAPRVHAWIEATALLRAPVAQRQYCRASDFVGATAGTSSNALRACSRTKAA
jgi:hypothetical protein